MAALARPLRQVGYSYRALLGWLTPLDYAITMFFEPAAQLVFFVYLGRFGTEEPSFYIVGNAIRLMSFSALFGATSVILNERRQGTLSALLATPTPVAWTFFSRSLLQGLSGLITGVFALSLGVLLFSLDLSAAAPGWTVLAMVLTALSLSGLGLFLANLGLVGTDPSLSLNIAFYALIVVTGANVPLDDLPASLAAVGRALPMTHGLEAVRLTLTGETAGVLPLLVREVATGALYAFGAILLFRFAEQHARRSGTLDLV